MTGPYAAFGQQYRQGAQAAADYINARGGVNGESISLVVADDAGEPRQAVAVANRLVHERVIGMVGHANSSRAIPTNELYDEEGILSITAGSTSPEVTGRGLSCIFRMCGQDGQQGTVAGDFVVDKLKKKSVAIIHDKDTYGEGLACAVRQQLEKQGLKPVLFEGLTRSERDTSAYTEKIRTAKADVVFFDGLYADAGPLFRGVQKAGLKDVAFIGGDGIATKAFVSCAGGTGAVAGTYMTFAPDPRVLHTATAATDAFRKAGVEPEGYTLHAYAAVQALVAAINSSKGSDADRAANWLHQNEVQTILGPKRWDSRGDVVDSGFAVHQWDTVGNYVAV